ncbi:MAG TPA: MraY family glycosyltransferase [Vicinamibacteria bacterium]|jgi:UDP-GlcNAc:undecaprenyl-phosphate GlcNAc-1-phosphate transferase
MPIYLLTAAIPLGMTLLLTPWIRSRAIRHGFLDRPGGRKAHDAPKPRLGGIAIYLSFSATVLVGFALAPWMASVPALRSLLPEATEALREAWSVRTPLIGLLLGGTIMFVVGLLDDLLGERFPTRWKFATQIVAASVAVACGVRVDFAGHDAVNVLVSVLWIVGISNAFNLLDNMDGLTAGVAAVSASVFLINAAELGEIFICFILAALIGTLVGFLRFNFPPASLFMGDSGSLFLGFILSSLTMLEHYVSSASSTLFPVLMPPLVLAVPLLDTMSVIYIRISEGRPIHVGDRCHLSHRLVRCGLSPLQAVVFLYLVTFGLGLGALHLADAPLTRSVWIVLDSVLLAALVLWVIRFGGRLRSEDPSSAHARKVGATLKAVEDK